MWVVVLARRPNQPHKEHKAPRCRRLKLLRAYIIERSTYYESSRQPDRANQQRPHHDGCASDRSALAAADRDLQAGRAGLRDHRLRAWAARRYDDRAGLRGWPPDELPSADPADLICLRSGAPGDRPGAVRPDDPVG